MGDDRRRRRAERVRRLPLCCSFCGRAEREVEDIVIGPDVAICNRCVTESVGLVAEYSQGRPTGLPRGRPTPRARRIVVRIETDTGEELARISAPLTGDPAAFSQQIVDATDVLSPNWREERDDHRG